MVSEQSFSSSADAIYQAIQAAEQILVITHVGPDGDAVSSLTAVGQLLAGWGKNFTLLCDDTLPERFRYLLLSNRGRRTHAANAVYDLLIAVDCGDELRMGQAFATLPQPRPSIINIDHHATNTRFGQINLVVDTAVSTTEILYDLFAYWQIPLTQPLAMSLLTGLVTDTLCFRTVGTSAKTLKIASELMAAGADLALITTQGLSLKEYSTVKLWRYGLDNMALEDGLAWTTISREERRLAGHNGSSSNGLGNILADINEAAMGLVLMELGDGNVRAGFRCRPPYNVAQIAQQFGGGGHPLAAGCTVHGRLADVEAQVVAASKVAIQAQALAATD